MPICWAHQPAAAKARGQADQDYHANLQVYFGDTGTESLQSHKQCQFSLIS